MNPHSLGEFDPNNDYAVYREGRFERVRLWRSWATPAYFNSTIYYGDFGDALFTMTNARLVAPPAS